MQRPPSFLMALFAAIALLLTLISVERAAAGHDVKEAWNKYQEALHDRFMNRRDLYPHSEILRINQLEFDNASNPYLPDFWLNYEQALNDFNDAENRYESILYHNNVLDARVELAERNYNNALEETVNDAVFNVLRGPEAKPPGLGDYAPIKKHSTKASRTRKRHSTSASRTRRSQTVKRPDGHSPQATNTTRALIFLGLSAINRSSTSRGSRRGPRGGSGGGGSSCAGGSCPP